MARPLDGSPEAPAWDRPSRFRDRQRSAPESRRPVLSEWDQAWAQFIATERVARDWGAATVENFQWANGDRLRAFRQVKGIDRPADFTDDLFYEFFNGLKEAGLGEASRIKLRNCIRSFLTWTRDKGLRKEGAPSLKIRQPREATPDHLLPEEISQVLDQCRTDRDRLIIKLMIWTGMRVGEVTAPGEGEESRLTIDMLDLNSLQPCIRGVASHKESDDAKPTPIPLIDGFDRDIKAFLAKRPAQTRYRALFLTDRKINGEYQPLTRSAVQSMVKRLKKDCEIAQLHPHALRHTFGILMADKMGIHWTQQVMRHARSSTTDRYLKAREEMILGSARAAKITLPKVGTRS